MDATLFVYKYPTGLLAVCLLLVCRVEYLQSISLTQLHLDIGQKTHINIVVNLKSHFHFSSLRTQALLLLNYIRLEVVHLAA